VLSTYVLWFPISLVAALALTPPVRRFASYVGAIDKPGKRKIHKNATPVAGGIAIYLAMLPAVLVASVGVPSVLPVWMSATIILLLGFVDDIKGLGAWSKLAVEAFAAFIPILCGVRIEFLSIPFDGIGYIGWLSYPLTLLWLVGVTNAVNLIDGLDGLATGVCGLAGMTIGVLALTNGQAHAAIIGFAVAGACLGFLRYNLSPATIFLGDTGALFLGYVLAVVSMMGVAKGATLLSLVISVFILGVPVLDTAVSILRRIIGHQYIFNADRDHLHHKLVDKGFQQRDAVYIVYLVSIASNGIAMVLGHVPIVYYSVCVIVFASAVAGLTWYKTKVSLGRAGDSIRPASVAQPEEIAASKED